MKKFLFILAIFCVSSFSYAQETMNEVFLNLNYGERQEYNMSLPEINDMKIIEDEEVEDYIFHPMKYIKEEAKELYLKKTPEKEKNYNKTIIKNGEKEKNK